MRITEDAAGIQAGYLVFGVIWGIGEYRGASLIMRFMKTNAEQLYTLYIVGHLGIVGATCSSVPTIVGNEIPTQIAWSRFLGCHAVVNQPEAHIKTRDIAT